MPKVWRAKPVDVAAVAAIHVRSWQAAYSIPENVLAGLSVTEREESWRQLFAGNEHHWLNLVAEDDRNVVGFCALTTPSRDAGADERLAEVGALYVDPGRWREGVGSALLRTALEELEEKRLERGRALGPARESSRPRLLRSLRLRVEEGVEKREERSGQPVIRLQASIGR